MTSEHAEWKACDQCGNAAPYEPLMIGDQDFGGNFPHVCPACQAKAEREEEARQRAEVIAEREREIERMIPPRIRRTDIAHPEFNAQAWRVVERWSPHAGNWLVMVGESGLCKTRLMGLLAMRMIRQGLKVAWTSDIGFQAAALREHDADAKERNKARSLLALWKSCDVLCIDDFGKSAGDGKEGVMVKAERHLFDILDHRFHHDLPVILGANTHPADMLALGLFTKDRGTPLVGRILEGAGNVLRLVAQPRQLEL
jgi:chromosomal replication initiation ATPase DnaA